MNDQGTGSEKGSLVFSVKVSLVAALGGLLFGYDTAVIAGAIGFLEKKFQLTPAMVGWVASSAIYGCVAGVLMAGYWSDRLGRKKILIVTAFLFAVSGIGSAIPHDLTTFTIARFVGGIAVGAASMLAPLYISEIAPRTIRGRLITLYQLAIVIGINLIYYINLKIASSGSADWNVEMGWRYMLGSETIPAVIFFLLLFLVPESPRWLVKEKREQEALAILTRVNGKSEGRQTLTDIYTSMQLSSGSVKDLFQTGTRKALLVGIVLALFSQITGINAIIYYAPELFRSAGLDTGLAFSHTLIIGTVNTLFTFVALWLIDQQGRKKLLLWGVAGMIVCLSGIILCFYLHADSFYLLIFILGYIACFASSLGPIPWIIIAEIFPIRTRGAAMSIATVVLWIGVILVTQLTPVLMNSLGGAWMFLIFMINAIILFLFAWNRIPETKNLSLEEIEQSW